MENKDFKSQFEKLEIETQDIQKSINKIKA